VLSIAIGLLPICRRSKLLEWKTKQEFPVSLSNRAVSQGAHFALLWKCGEDAREVRKRGICEECVPRC